MALIQCPECNNNISEFAESCIYCGFPIANKKSKPTKRRSYPKKCNVQKRGNGDGSVHRLTGNRRKPWRVRITDKTVPVYDEKGEIVSTKQKYINVGYYETEEEAILALMEYNKNPYDTKKYKMTFEEAYSLYLPEKLKNVKEDNKRTYDMCFNHSKKLHKMRLNDIRPAHMEECISSAPVSPGSKQKMKALYKDIFEWAIANDLAQKNYAELIFPLGGMEKVEVKEANPFSREEIKTLWDNVDKLKYVDVVLLHIYGGWRINELCNITLDSIDLDNCCIVGGSKTEAGINRTVPIHKDILHLVEKRIAEAKRLNSNYLLNDQGSKTGLHFTDNKYQKRFNQIMKDFGMEHRTQDCRKTFSTFAKKSKTDEYLLKRILGHKINDVTESTYTKRDIAELKEAIDNIVFV